MTNLPVTGIFNITCEFGRKGKWLAGFHTGIDITCDNDKIYSTCDGEVIRTGYDKSYGNFIVVKCILGNYHWFCHLSKILVHNGKVNRATIIGIMGNTGNSTGKHLHYEIRKPSNKYGDVENPTSYMGIANKVQNGLNSKNFNINNDRPSTSINVGDIKKFKVNSNIREQPTVNSKSHLYRANTTVEIKEVDVAHNDGYVWDKVFVIYANAKDFKEGYVARTCERYQ